MNKILVSACLLAVSTFSVNALAEAAKIATPEKMTCKEYVDLNPQSWAPVALWVTNQGTQFKGGDFVTLTEESVAEAPLIINFCKKYPEGTLQDYLASKK